MKSKSNLKKGIETNSKRSGSAPSHEISRHAFTLIELLVVIAIIAILAAVLLPVLHQAKLRGETATCIANQKQLTDAFVMYSTDNNDNCVGNYWPGEQNFNNPPPKYPQNWISGWMDPSGTSPNNTASEPNGDGDADNTNAQLLVNSKYALFAEYVRVPKLYACPSDSVLVDTTQGGIKNVTEIRSVSMNSWVGNICSPPPGTNAANTAYKMFHKVTDITAGMGPADLFVFMEERGESIDDGSFAVIEDGSTSIENWPTDYHNLAATVGFADGHVEVHRWFGEVTSLGYSCTAPPVPEPPTKWGTAMVMNNTQYADLIWMQQHASCKK